MARSLHEDSIQLTGLVRTLGLTRFTWLAQMLFWEFSRIFLRDLGDDTAQIEITLPPGLPPWATRGKRPKRSGPKGTRLEDLERIVTTFYRCEVQDPPTPKRRLAIEQGRSRSDVQHDCSRAAALLELIDPPDPPR